jgi:hypothetical protein
MKFVESDASPLACQRDLTADPREGENLRRKQFILQLACTKPTDKLTPTYFFRIAASISPVRLPPDSRRMLLGIATTRWAKHGIR